MEISWNHEYHGHYVRIKSEGISCSEYPLRLMKENRLPGLLPVRKKSSEEGMFYAYEVTGCESLKKRWQVCPPGYQEIKGILVQLTEIVRQAEEYLLDSDKLLLDPDIMFLENARLTLCYYPEKQTGFYETFRGFAEQMITAADHRDIRGTEFAYALYEACQKETFVLETYLKKSWQGENQRQEEMTLPEVPEPYTEPKAFIRERGLQSFFGRSKRKKREQIRREFWTEVWKLKGTKEFIVDKSPFVIGKQKDGVDACLESVHVSRRHAQLEQERGLFFLTDLNSMNGTFINGRRVLVGKNEVLSPGDRIAFADEVFLFVKEERD